VRDASDSQYSFGFTLTLILSVTFRTTYLYPAEVFPTRFRASAHGVSAACGKAGAIISSLGFNQLTKQIGTPNVLWSRFIFFSLKLHTLTVAFASVFFGVCLLGAAATFLLPEVRGRDPDLLDMQELKEAKQRASHH